MKKEVINRVATKLRWTAKEVRKAIDEIDECESHLKIETLIDICARSTNPDERLRNSVEYFINNSQEHPVDLISNLLLNDDPCFNIIALFNIYDSIISDKKRELSNGNNEVRIIHSIKFNRPGTTYMWMLSYATWDKSFIQWEVHAQYTEGECENFLFGTLEDHYITTLEDISFDPDKLKLKFIDIYITYLSDGNQLAHLFPEPSSVIDEFQPLLRAVIRKAGFLAFGIEVFNRQVYHLSKTPQFKECRENIDKLYKAFAITPEMKVKFTERKYWLWYLLVEKLIENGYGVRAAFRKAVEALGESTAGGVNKQYYVMKKRALENNLRNTDIINIHGLKIPLEKLLIKAGIMQEESIWG